MPDKEQQVRNLSERVVKEAVGVGLETPMREPILEAIEESGESPSMGKRQLPLAGALLGLGAAVGYLAGRSEHESIDGSRMIEDLVATTETEDRTEPDEDTELEAEEASAEPEADEGDGETADTGGRMLPRILLGLGILGAVALIRRRMQSDEGEEWEPIEEFEPAVEFGEEGEDEEATADEEQGEDDTDADEMAADETEE